MNELQLLFNHINITNQHAGSLASDNVLSLWHARGGMSTSVPAASLTDAGGYNIPASVANGLAQPLASDLIPSTTMSTTVFSQQFSPFLNVE
jgi:hypothetical protein